MRTFVSGRMVSVFASALALLVAAWHGSESSVSVAQEPQALAAAAAVNPFHGTYQGGFWGTVPGLGPYGGDIRCTISSAGVVSLALPGKGSGTVAATGVYTARGTLKVLTNTVAVSYYGNIEANQAPNNRRIFGSRRQRHMENNNSWRECPREMARTAHSDDSIDGPPNTVDRF